MRFNESVSTLPIPILAGIANNCAYAYFHFDNAKRLPITRLHDSIWLSMHINLLSGKQAMLPAGT